MLKGLAYLLTPLVIGAMIVCPRIQCWISTTGMVLMCLSLAAGSFSLNTTHLALTQGVMYGIGGSLAFTPAIVFTNEWFVKRRGFAFGFVWVGLYRSISQVAMQLT